MAVMRLFPILLLLLPAVAFGKNPVPNPDLMFNSNFSEDTTPWEEMAASLPAYPKNENLVSFFVTAASGSKFMIDAAAVSLGKDDVVRYTVVIESSRGARTMNYEGLRCATMERKIYAFGQPDGKWSENKRAAWEVIKVRSQLSYHKPLFEDIFCDRGMPPADAEDAVRKLKQAAWGH